MRISNDSLRTACDRLSQGIFNLARMKKCATRRLLLIIFFKWISVQDNNSGWGRKGVRGGGCGRPALGGLSFSITKSVATTPLIGQMDDAMCGGRGGVCDCVWGRGPRDGQTCVRARLPPVPARLFPTMPP